MKVNKIIVICILTCILILSYLGATMYNQNEEKNEIKKTIITDVQFWGSKDISDKVQKGLEVESKKSKENNKVNSSKFIDIDYDILKDGHHLYAGGEDNFTELSIGKDLAKASTVKEFLPYVNKAVGYLTMGAYEDKIRDQFVGKTWHGMKIKDCEITTYKVHESHNLDISDEDILKEEGIMNLPKGKFTALAGGYNNMNDDDNIYFVRVVVIFE